MSGIHFGTFDADGTSWRTIKCVDSVDFSSDQCGDGPASVSSDPFLNLDAGTIAFEASVDTSVLAYLTSVTASKLAVVVERRQRLLRHDKVWKYKAERKGDRGKRRRKARWLMTRTMYPNVRFETHDGELAATVSPIGGEMD